MRHWPSSAAPSTSSPTTNGTAAPSNQFTLWFGANMQITAIVDGALAVVFGADAIWAIVGLLIGNVLGGIVMALHSAQGPRLGLPQMISSRAQFGVYGAVVPLLLVVLMYLGFAATGTVLAGQAVNEILHLDNPAVGIIIFGVLTAVVAVTGYKLIHTVGRIATAVGIIGFSYLAVRLFADYDVASVIGAKPFDIRHVPAGRVAGGGLAADVRTVRRRLFALSAAHAPAVARPSGRRWRAASSARHGR